MYMYLWRKNNYIIFKKGEINLEIVNEYTARKCL